jgi:HD-GYP domain-containing protein (c-di-GMP phosphodiesterase class II)
MTSDRPYRAGMPKEKALEILLENAGTQWDKELVKAFVEAQKSQ